MSIETGASIGPNSISQTALALRDIAGTTATERIFSAAGLSGYLAKAPDQMVPEAEAARLFDSLRRSFSPAMADSILAEAGRRTGRYIIANRIPGAAAWVIQHCPTAIGARLLISAIGQHAWTFAGSGRVEIRRGADLELCIRGNPLATPGCAWHTATLECLFKELVSARARVVHAECAARGDAVCRFSITFPRAANHNHVRLRTAARLQEDARS
ncbi:MAG: bacteriochlorophyll 4-vinyl reductase [Proteobacteria bacterium]|nr:bacteriochlorophyll 4-vinyl reductase [Pseudomonadota bacterium]